MLRHISHIVKDFVRIQPLVHGINFSLPQLIVQISEHGHIYGRIRNGEKTPHHCMECPLISEDWQRGDITEIHIVVGTLVVAAFKFRQTLVMVDSDYPAIVSKLGLQ